MARRLYVDSSAYVCALLGEPGGEEIVSETRGAELVSSILLALEAEGALVHNARRSALTPERFELARRRLEEDLSLFVLRDFTADVCRSEDLPSITAPRPLDLAHLRTALWFHRRSPLTRFVSMDRAQIQAARELRLPT